MRPCEREQRRSEVQGHSAPARPKWIDPRGERVNCKNCTAETTNGLALCARCRQTLTVALVNVAAYYADVLRIKPGERVKVRSAYQSTPPPGTEPARDVIGEAADAAASMIFTWCRALADDRPQAGKIPTTTEVRCGWLESHVDSIATLEWAAELLRDARQAERQLQRILDRADTGWYAGVCGNEIGRETIDGIVYPVLCERGLYGSDRSSWVRCPECGRTWDADSRRAKMISEARMEVAPVSVIARAVVGLVDTESSVQRLANRIDKWVSRGKLHDLGVRVLDGKKPQRVYRIGDVFDLIEKNTPKADEAC